MKRFFAILLTCAVALGAVGCGEKVEPNTKEESIPEDMYAMTEPIDSLMRCMIENQMEYAPEDPLFFWTSLSYFLGGYATDHPLTETTTDGWLKVPRKVAQEYAIALFAKYSNLLELPTELENRVTYDKAADSYFIALGDIGLSKTVLSNMVPAETDYTLTAQLLSAMEDEDLIGEWEVTLVKNAFADGIENPTYLYSVAKMKEIVNNANLPITTSAVFNGLADGHTVEVTLEDGTISSFQFSDPIVTERLKEMNAKDAFSFRYTEDTELGVMYMIAID